MICLIIIVLTVTDVLGYKNFPKQACDDIAIIGAGIAGSYAAWRLRNENKRISLYEFSDRVGGRCYTVKLPGVPDINVELGAMRFYPERHTLLYNTIRQLGLQVIDFDLGTQPFPDTMVYMRGRHLRHDELGGPKTPFNLLPHEKKHPRQLLWEMFKNNTDVEITNIPEDLKKFFVKTKDGVELFKQSYETVVHKSLSIEAQHYLKETTTFPGTLNHVSASYKMVTSPPDGTKNAVKTVASGFNSIPETLVKQFLQSSTRHNLVFNHHLKAIRKAADGTFRLYFDKTRTQNGRTRFLKEKPLVCRCARKVILAINRLSLERLDWNALYEPKIREYLTDAVKDYTAVKMYLSYNFPWWRTSPLYANYSISDSPLRLTYDFGTSKFSTKSILQTAYNDVDATLWREIASRTNGKVTDGDISLFLGEEAVQLNHRYLSEIYRIDARTIPKPNNAILAVWSEYPYGGGWQLWQPGYIWPEVEKAMIKPCYTDDVFIVNNAFNSEYLSIWTNGALQSVELALNYFNIAKPMNGT